MKGGEGGQGSVLSPDCSFSFPSVVSYGFHLFGLQPLGLWLLKSPSKEGHKSRALETAEKRIGICRSIWCSPGAPSPNSFSLKPASGKHVRHAQNLPKHKLHQAGNPALWEGVGSIHVVAEPKQALAQPRRKPPAGGGLRVQWQEPMSSPEPGRP